MKTRLSMAPILGNQRPDKVGSTQVGPEMMEWNMEIKDNMEKTINDLLPDGNTRENKKKVVHLMTQFPFISLKDACKKIVDQNNVAAAAAAAVAADAAVVAAGPAVVAAGPAVVAAVVIDLCSSDEDLCSSDEDCILVSSGHE
jgi:hypothetical protein